MDEPRVGVAFGKGALKGSDVDKKGLGSMQGDLAVINRGVAA